jgi:outer membrane lipoprotein SlyB
MRRYAGNGVLAEAATRTGADMMTASGYYGPMRATDADRDKVHAVLQAAYADGRLTWDEFDARSTQLIESKTYAQLSALTADLRRPVPYQPQYAQRPFGPSSRINGLAGVSLGFGIGQIIIPIFGAIIAIITGHVARGQIRRTGEHGDGLAIAGLVLGYIGILIPILLIVLAAVAAGSGGHAVVVHPGPPPPPPPPGP